MNAHRCPTCGHELQLVEVPDPFDMGRSQVFVTCVTPLCWRGPSRATAPEAVEAAAPILRSAWDRALEETGRIMAALAPEEVEQGKAMVHGLIPPLVQILGLLTVKEDGGVWNHISWRIGGAPAPIGELELVLQRVEGETPIQQRDAARAVAARLQAALVQVQEGAAGNAGVCENCDSIASFASDTLVGAARLEDTILPQLWAEQSMLAGVRYQLGGQPGSDLVALATWYREREQALAGALRDVLTTVKAYVLAEAAIDTLHGRWMGEPEVQSLYRNAADKITLLETAMNAAQGLMDQDDRPQPVDR